MIEISALTLFVCYHVIYTFCKEKPKEGSDVQDQKTHAIAKKDGGNFCATQPVFGIPPSKQKLQTYSAMLAVFDLQQDVDVEPIIVHFNFVFYTVKILGPKISNPKH